MSHMEIFVSGLGQFFGVFLGVIAGTAVTIAVQQWHVRRQEKNQIRSFQIELELNARKLEEWIEELGRYRNAVNGDSLPMYFGYFKLSSFLGVMAFQLHNSGVIYKLLSQELVGQLQEVYNDLSLYGENYINNQIKQRKQTLASLQERGGEDQWQAWLKPQAVSDIDFWEERFKGHLRTVRAVMDALG